jgi:hypothetical protein
MKKKRKQSENKAYRTDKTGGNPLYWAVKNFIYRGVPKASARELLPCLPATANTPLAMDNLSTKTLKGGMRGLITQNLITIAPR